jgi:hypothetical protein
MEGKGTRRVQRISGLRWGRLREVNGLYLVIVKYHWLYVPMETEQSKMCC